MLIAVRFIRYRPRKALVILGIFLLVTGLLTVTGLWVWFEYHLKAARLALDAGHNTDATSHLRSCQQLRPRQREVLLLSARAARRAGSWEEADDLLTQYWQSYGDDEPLVFERLLYRTAHGEVETAGLALRARVAQGGPEARLAREALVVGLTYRFRWLEVRAVLDAWLAETPDDTLGLIQLGKYLEQQHGFVNAIEIYRRIIELDPLQLEARLRLATILVSRRYGEDAAGVLAVLREKLPDHPEVQLLWAKSLSLLGRTDEARQAIDACLRSHPNYPPALVEKGNNSLYDGDEAGAEECLALAVRLDPGNSQARNKYALVLSRNGKAAQAAAEYARARQLEADGERIAQIINGPLQAHPNDPALHHEIGMIALRSGLPSEAMRWFTSALQVDPDHLPTHQVLANIYREIENPALAAKHRAIAQKLMQQQKH